MQHRPRNGPNAGSRTEVYLDKQAEHVLHGLRRVYGSTLRLPQVSVSSILRRALDALQEDVESLDADGLKDEALRFAQYRVARPSTQAAEV